MIWWLISRGHHRVWEYGYSLLIRVVDEQARLDAEHARFEAALHGMKLKE